MFIIEEAKARKELHEIDAAPEYVALLKQAFNMMLRNYVGFQRIAAIAAWSYYRERPMPIYILPCLASSALNSETKKFEIHLEVYGDTEMSADMILAHELTHVYHQLILGTNHNYMIINGKYDSTIKMKKVVKGVLAI